jgi:hypothetical protein
VLTPIQRLAGLHRHAALSQSRDEIVQAVHEQSGVRLARRAEIEVHTKVDLHAVGLEPTASAFGQVLGLEYPRNAQQSLVERGGLRLFALWHSELNVVEAANPHCSHGDPWRPWPAGPHR